ncbi:MAG TPA: GNAT family N-acetyltransferase, partial [Caldilineaceae bacterium]|nr:GNAT family N-acetyltransferase [Caldilineaceae bacterium]
WFGMEQSIINYGNDIAHLPTFVATTERTVIGFLTLKIHTAYAAEIWVMGVRPDYHRQSIGKALLVQAEYYLRQTGIEYLQVKTISAADSSPNYAKTRAFYTAVGFRPLEELTELWSAENPCLQMIKWIGVDPK